MIAYRIKVNGEHIATIGQDDMSILTASILASKGNTERGVDDYIRLSLGGLSHKNEEGFIEHFRWKDLDLQIEDIVEIEVVETDTIDPPTKRFRSDKEVQENPYTEDEWRDMKYRDYLELKKEFEGDAFR